MSVHFVQLGVTVHATFVILPLLMTFFIISNWTLLGFDYILYYYTSDTHLLYTFFMFFISADTCQFFLIAAGVKVSEAKNMILSNRCI